MENTKLDIAKNIIKENFVYGDCGIFNSRNLIGETTINLYDEDGLIIDICYDWGYFEVFGLSDSEFEELDEYYNSLKKN